MDNSLVLILAVLLLTLPTAKLEASDLSAAQGAVELPSETTSRSSVAALVKATIVSNQMLLYVHPELLVDKAFNSHYSDIAALMAVLDVDGIDPEGLVLASLASYNLGAAETENLFCLTRRNGRKMESVLRRLAASTENECQDKLLKEFVYTGRQFGGPGICKSGEAYSAMLSKLIEAAVSRQACSLEQ